jgi:hypothetical protein
MGHDEQSQGKGRKKVTRRGQGGLGRILKKKK